MSNESIKQTARTLFEYVDRGDLDSWRSLIGPDVAASANGGDTMNRDEFEGMVRGIGSAFSNGRHIIDTQVVEGDVVATNLTWTAVHTGEFEGVPASNRPVRISGSSFDRIVDGKVVEHHAQFDAMALMVQIGAIPVPA